MRFNEEDSKVDIFTLIPSYFKDEFKTTGLHFSFRYEEECLVNLFNFMKDNYDESILFYNEILKMIKKNQLSYLYKALFENSSAPLDIYKIRVLRKKYSNFFKMFNIDSKKNDFWNSLFRYLLLMSYVFDKLNDYSEKERTEFFDKSIDNFKRIKDLEIDDIYFKFDNHISELITLIGQPLGMYTKLFPVGKCKYKEENFYTDGEIEDTYNSEKKCVDIKVQRPNFIVRNERSIYYNPMESPFHFDKKSWYITIYNLDFDGSKLPSYEEIRDTECHLDSYLTLMYDKKCELFKKKIAKLASLLNDLYSQLDNLTDLSDELGIKDLLKDEYDLKFNGFDEDELIMLQAANSETIDNFIDRHVKTLKKKVN